MEKVFNFATANVSEMRNREAKRMVLWGGNTGKSDVYDMDVVSGYGRKGLWHGGGLSCRMEASREKTKEREDSGRSERSKYIIHKKMIKELSKRFRRAMVVVGLLSAGMGVSAGTLTPEKNAEGAYQLSSASDLRWFAYYCNETDLTASAVLTADIEMTGNWTPIGSSYNASYAGTFDGAGHTIYGLFYNKPSESVVGLFGFVGQGGTVKNVTVENSSFTCGSYVGAIAGCANGTIENCHTGTNTTVEGQSKVGGICGSLGGSIVGSSNGASVTGKSHVGGIVGYNDYQISCCYNKGKLTGKSGNYSVGGVCGENYGMIATCYNVGELESVQAKCVIVGYNGSNGSVSNCYYLGTEETDEIDGTTVKSESEFKSGELCYELNSRFGSPVYFQTVGEGYPAHSGETVYRECTTEGYKYVNELSGTGHIDEDEDGHCDLCKAAYRIEKKDGAYMIKSVSDLYDFAYVVNDLGETSAVGILCNDITVNENVLKDGALNGDGSTLRAWTPIGKNGFKGLFYGQGYHISGLYVNDAEAENVGLFGNLTGWMVVVRGVCLKDTYFHGKSNVGGISGNGSSMRCGQNIFAGVLVAEDAEATVSYAGGTKSYYEAAESNEEGAKTAEEFRSGYVCYLMNEGEKQPIYGQTIGEDEYPHAGGKTVYRQCTAEGYAYTNAELENYHYDGDEDGVCDVCGAFCGIEEPEIKEGVYQISKRSELYWFANYVNSSDANAEAKGAIVADIEVNANLMGEDGEIGEGKFVSWEPIGTESRPFKGTLDGQGHTISGLYISASSKSYMGLVGNAEGAEIENLTIEGAYMAVNCYSGIVCGQLTGGKIAGCKTSGKIVGNSEVGGICGQVCGEVEIEDCESEAVVLAMNSFNGGICGKTDSGSKTGIRRCVNKGRVEATSNSSNQIGGILGESYGETTIEDCRNEGDIEASAHFVGGIVGYGQAKVSNCVNTAAVTAGAYVGGIGGYLYDGVVVENCENAGNITATEASSSTFVGGIIGNLQGRVEDCVNRGKIVSRGEYVGGIVGYMVGSVVASSENHGDIEANPGPGKTITSGYVGGVCGEVEYGSKVLNCHNTGNIDAEGFQHAYLGGIVGDVSSSTVVNSYNTGALSTDGDYFGGGFGLSGWATIENCYNAGSMTHRPTEGRDYSFIRLFIGQINGDINYRNLLSIGIDGFEHNQYEEENIYEVLTAEEFADGTALGKLREYENAELGTDGKIWGQIYGRDMSPTHVGVAGYAIRYENIEEDDANENPEYYVEGEGLTLVPAAREGYEFKGWYLDEAFETEEQTEISSEAKSPVTLYAQWEEIPTVVTTIEAKKAEEAKEEIYTIGGVKVREMTRGVYVRNGRLVIVK